MQLPEKNVVLLSLGQALGSTGSSLIVFVGGMTGTELAPSPALVTLPVTMMVIGTALAAIPASLFMAKVGRKRGFLMSAGLSIAGALAASGAILLHNFVMFCAAVLLLGTNSAFVQQYRFAAAESVAPKRVGVAVSTVLAGGIAGGFLGPQIGKITWNWLPAAAYSGSFAALAGVYLLTILILLALSDIQTQTTYDPREGTARPLSEILRRPLFRLAVFSGMVSYGAMVLLMTATPISMHVMDRHSLEATGWVIQSHIVAMYLPSLFSGWLLARLKPLRLLGVGIAALTVCVGIAMSGRALTNYWFALVLLGVGWNFLFVGGTVLLTESYRPAERFRAQAFNDFSVFGIQALASLSAGAILHAAGWPVLAALVLPFLIALGVGAWLAARQERFAPQAGQEV